MKKKVLVVEDEVIIAESHKDQLLSFGIDEVRIAHSYWQAILCLENFVPDLILLDLRLKEKFEGLELADKINQEYNYPIIFITAHADEKTLQSVVSTKPFAYLNKPVRKSELFSAVMLALNSKETKLGKNIKCLEEAGTKIRFDINDLVMVKSNGNYIQLHLADNKKHLIRMTMETLMAELEDPGLFRINRSYIVNLRHVHAVKSKNAFIQDQKLSISPNVYEDFIQLFEG
jgi:two-component system, LytTR family, response regulator LytT